MAAEQFKQRFAIKQKTNKFKKHQQHEGIVSDIKQVNREKSFAKFSFLRFYETFPN